MSNNFIAELLDSESFDVSIKLMLFIRAEWIVLVSHSPHCGLPSTNNPIPVRPQQAPSPFDFPVFQAGKRICLGQRMVSAGLGMNSLYRAVSQAQRVCTPN